MRLVRAVRQRFEGSAAFLDDPQHREFVREYLDDMVRPSNLALDAELSGHSYGEMAEALLRTAVAPDERDEPDEPVDMLVVAFANHDVYPGRALATYLSSLCPGTPLSFAICDQESAAAFTALQVIHAAKPTRALLLVLEQSALPYASDAPLPEQHQGVALLLDSGGAPSIRVSQHAGVDAVDAADVPQLQLLKPDTPLIISEALAAAWPGHPPDAMVASSKQPITGIWWLLADLAVELAAERATGPAPERATGLATDLAAGQDRVIVADYDPLLRYLCSVELSPVPAKT